MAGLVLKNVNKTYAGGHQIIRDFSLSVEGREFIVLAGPEGCGKSTILRMIAGLTDISSGQIQIDGVDAALLTPRERKLAMIFRNSVLYPELTVGENLAFSLRLGRPGLLAQDEDEETVQETARFLNIEELLGKLPAQLNQLKTCLALLGRALIRKPEFLLIDSHIGEMEETVRRRLQEIFLEVYRKKKLTILYAAEGREAAEFSDVRLVLMEEGAIFQDGPAAEVYAKPNCRFCAEFMSDPGLNLFRARVIGEENRVGLALASGKLFLTEEMGGLLAREGCFGKEVLLGLRAQELHLARETETDGSFAAVLQGMESWRGRPVLRFTVDSEEGRAFADTYVGEAGSKVNFGANMEHALLFDPESGKALL